MQCGVLSAVQHGLVAGHGAVERGEVAVGDVGAGVGAQGGEDEGEEGDATV